MHCGTSWCPSCSVSDPGKTAEGRSGVLVPGSCLAQPCQLTGVSGSKPECGRSVSPFQLFQLNTDIFKTKRSTHCTWQIHPEASSSITVLSLLTKSGHLYCRIFLLAWLSFHKSPDSISWAHVLFQDLDHIGSQYCHFRDWPGRTANHVSHTKEYDFYLVAP